MNECDRKNFLLLPEVLHKSQLELHSRVNPTIIFSYSAWYRDICFHLTGTLQHFLPYCGMNVIVLSGNLLNKYVIFAGSATDSCRLRSLQV